MPIKKSVQVTWEVSTLNTQAQCVCWFLFFVTLLVLRVAQPVATSTCEIGDLATCYDQPHCPRPPTPMRDSDAGSHLRTSCLVSLVAQVCQSLQHTRTQRQRTGWHHSLRSCRSLPKKALMSWRWKSWSRQKDFNWRGRAARDHARRKHSLRIHDWACNCSAHAHSWSPKV